MTFAKKNILIFHDTPLLIEIFINTFKNIIDISILVRNFSTSFQQFFLHFFFLFLLILFLFIYISSFSSSTDDFYRDFWCEICSDFNIDFWCFFKNKKVLSMRLNHRKISKICFQNTIRILRSQRYLLRDKCYYP